MKMVFLYFLLFCFLQHAVGQVSGKLINNSGQPVPFANVFLLIGKDSLLAKAALTNETGTYRLENISNGSYILRLSSTGYQTWDSPVFELTDLQKSKDFGTQLMKENTKILDEVIVRSEKPLIQQRPEGTIVNVEGSLLTKGIPLYRY